MRLRSTAVAAVIGVAAGVAGCGNGAPRHTTTVSVVGSPAPASVSSGALSEAGQRDVSVALGPPSRTFTPSSDASSGAPGANRLSHAMVAAKPGAVIHLASGHYPLVLDVKRRTGWVTVSGSGDASLPVLAGAKLLGASDVRFVDVRFKKVRIAGSPDPRYPHPARNIQILDSEVDCGATQTAGGGMGILVRGGAHNITISGDDVHDCTVGFSSVAQDAQSTNVSLTHDTFEDFYGDAIDLGAMKDLTIADDVIRQIARHGGVEYHDDGIQFFGNTDGVLIADNVLANSLDQLIFVQDAVKSLKTGSSVNRDVLILGNLVYGAGAIAVQDQGGVDVQFVGNTIWASKDGTMLVRRSGYTGIVPNHTLVADNIIETLAFDGVRGGVVQGYNVFSHIGRRHRGTHDVVGAAGFDDPREGRFALSPHSPAVGSAAPSAVLLAMARRAGADAGALEILRRWDSRDRGAIAASTSQTYGDPFVLTGRKLR